MKAKRRESDARWPVTEAQLFNVKQRLQKAHVSYTIERQEPLRGQVRYILRIGYGPRKPDVVVTVEGKHYLMQYDGKRVVRVNPDAAMQVILRRHNRESYRSVTNEEQTEVSDRGSPTVAS